MVAQPAAFRLGGRRHFRDVVQPAVERAAQPAVLQPAVREVRAAMRAVPVDEAVSAFIVFEENEVFAQDLYRPHRALDLQFIHQRDRLPIAAQQLARGRLRPTRVMSSFCSALIMSQEYLWRSRASGRSAARPRIGPRVSSRKSHCGPSTGAMALSSSMLAMVIEKPMQLAMVSAEPTSSRGALAAFSAENCARIADHHYAPEDEESEEHRRRRVEQQGRSRAAGGRGGELQNATGALPARSDASPPATQPMPPAAITANVQSGTASPSCPCAAACAASTRSTNAQKA